MITGYPYVAMLVTGCLHAALGLAGMVLAIVGATDTHVSNIYTNIYYTTYFAVRHYKTLYGVGILCSLWILLVGCLGISAGVSKLEDQVTRGLKTAYMVTAILSACIFSIAGSAMFTLTRALFGLFYGSNYYGVYVGGVTVMGIEFVLAIVSSSICCCCSSERTIGVVIQSPPMQTVHTVQTFGPQQTPGMQNYYGAQYQPQGIQGYYGGPNQPQGMQSFPGVDGQPPNYGGPYPQQSYPLQMKEKP